MASNNYGAGTIGQGLIGDAFDQGGFEQQRQQAGSLRAKKSEKQELINSVFSASRALQPEANKKLLLLEDLA